MDYDIFRTLWHEALVDAGLASYRNWSSETLNLDQMSRAYRLFLWPGDDQATRPFSVSARLEWEWSAALTARSVTTEEDLLTELLGPDGYLLVTEQPWLRVDLTLNAALPLNAPLSLPSTANLSRWVRQVSMQLEPLLPTMSAEDLEEEPEPGPLSWRGEPEARLHCRPNGNLLLAGVELSAWQGIHIPRQWDNPDREWDPDPGAQLRDFSQRLRGALDVWAGALGHLR